MRLPRLPSSSSRLPAVARVLGLLAVLHVGGARGWPRASSASTPPRHKGSALPEVVMLSLPKTGKLPRRHVRAARPSPAVSRRACWCVGNVGSFDQCRMRADVMPHVRRRDAACAQVMRCRQASRPPPPHRHTAQSFPCPAVLVLECLRLLHARATCRDHDVATCVRPRLAALSHGTALRAWRCVGTTSFNRFMNKVYKLSAQRGGADAHAGGGVKPRSCHWVFSVR